MTLPDQVRHLHGIYRQITGHEIALNFARERQWVEWLQWRREKPFTEADLRRVVGHIRRGLHRGERNEGALKFTNLIGQPDRFEEDLAIALQDAIQHRPRPAARGPRPAEDLPPPMSRQEAADFVRQFGFKPKE